MGTHTIIQINQITGKGTLFSGGEFTKIIPFEMYILTIYMGHSMEVGKEAKINRVYMYVGQIIAAAACSYNRS